MHTEAKARAVKLHDVLHDSGIHLEHAQCFDIIAKTDQHPDWRAHKADMSDDRQRAERYLDELLDAISRLDYTAFTKRFEDKYLAIFTEHEFKRSIRNAFEDLGSYEHREYLGCINGLVESDSDQYPERKRYFWRSFFEHNEALINVSIYHKDDTYYISGAHSL